MTDPQTPGSLRCGCRRRRPLPRRARLALAGLLALHAIAGDLAAQAPPAGGPPPQPVRVGAVAEETLADRRLVLGELRAARRALLASREPGLVVELPALEGRMVRAGETIARLDDVRIRLELTAVEADEKVARALLAERTADLEFRKWQHEAFVALAERGSSHERELREAASAIEVGRARIEQSASELAVIAARAALLRQRLADTVIAAPFDAVIVQRRTERGQWVGSGDAVVEIISTGGLEAWFDVPEALAAALRAPGAAIEIRVEAAGATLRATDLRVVPQIHPRTRTFPLVTRLEDAGALASGMSATAWVPAGVEARRLTVPKDALMRNDAGAFVFVARTGAAGGPAAAVAVRVDALFSHGDRVAVRSAELAAGDLVVVEGNERLLPGAPLAFTLEAAKR